MLADSYGRIATDLRVSLTDRCNLRCAYCMPPEGLDWLPTPTLLTDDEVVRLARIGVERLGITEIRYTGGEPLLRRGLPGIVARTAALRPRPETSLTTNGIGLARLAGPLAEAGLDRINVSLDTLRPDVFRTLAKRDRLADVQAGLVAAAGAGLAPVKVNAVLMRGFNEDEAVPLARWARDHDYELRFIEWMPLDAQHGWSRDQLVPASEILAQIRAEFPIEPARVGDPSAPATLYRYLDGRGQVGVIASVTRPFCGHCDRIRLTADGQIRTCLFSLKEYDFRTAMRGGATDEQIVTMLEAAVWRKEPGHLINSPYFRQPERGMSAIGG